MFEKTGNVIVKVAIVLVLVAGAVVAAMIGLRQPARVTEVKLGPATHNITGSVTVFADKDLQELKSEVAGRVVWTSPQFDEDGAFKKGDELVRLDARELERRIARAKSDYAAAVEQRKITRESNTARALAEQKLENALRIQKMGGDVSEEDVKALRRALNEIDTQLKLADLAAKKTDEDFKSDMAALNDQLDKMTIRATADGVIWGVMVAEGSLINAGATVATFYRNERVVVAKIGEEDFGHIRLEQPAKVRLLIYGDKDFDAKVSRILSAAEPQTQLYTVHLEVDVDPAKLIPNSTGEVVIEVGRRENQPLVPRRAVVNNEFVFVVNGGRVEKRKVELGYIGLNLAEIRKGLKPGELVIVENLEQYRPGQRVVATRVK